MATIEDILREPEYDPCTRCYVYPGGKEIPEIEYFAIKQHFRKLGEERTREANLGLEIKAHEANVYISEMASCQSPSVAISRARKRISKRL